MEHPSNPSIKTSSTELVNPNLSGHSRQEDLPLALHKPSRTYIKPLRYAISNFLTFNRVSPTYKTFLITLNQTFIPKTVADALTSIHWRTAMQEEKQALLKNHTWEEVDKKPKIKLIGCRWVFNIKYNSDVSLKRYKARLVAKGCTQSYGIDYMAIFTPVAKLNTVGY